MSCQEPVRPADGQENPTCSSCPLPTEKNEPLPSVGPVYHNMVYPDFFPTTHLPPGSYLSAGYPPGLEEEEEELRVKRKLRTLGYCQGASGIGSITLGILVVLASRWYISFVIMLGTPWWTGLFAAVSGIMALGVRNSPHNSVTIGCLVMNVINGIACIPATILYALSVEFYTCWGFFCFLFYWESLIALMMITLLLNCIFSLSVSVFVIVINCRKLRCCTGHSPSTMIVVQAAPPALDRPTQPCSSSSYPPDELPPAYTASPVQAVYNVPV
ncbi:uncharacterized protein LOC132207376 [Stegostoma tigrinum]|uniref:uncharacterized protein LOC132207376 n=1 Tax=Stegostoma tigrinum TaxID=3053191 RepID=UPI002870500D|nr:uncharacterized protein LOC132207376 [Stegostoma tigrinum]